MLNRTITPRCMFTMVVALCALVSGRAAVAGEHGMAIGRDSHVVNADMAVPFAKPAPAGDRELGLWTGAIPLRAKSAKPLIYRVPDFDIYAPLAEELFLTTLFASNNGSSGNMFDVQVTVPVTITRFAVNLGSVGTTNTVEIYYRLGTCVGYESSPVGWTLLGTDSAVLGNGTNVPSYVNVGGLELQPGQVYGLYVSCPGPSTVQYTDGGPSIFSNAQISLTTNCGKGLPAFTGSTFYPRKWNGTIYYTIVQQDALDVAPGDGLVSSGYEGGPFSPAEKTYTLTNNDANMVSWTAASNMSWVVVAPSDGVLAPGESTVVSASIGAEAGVLTPGSHYATTTFANTGSGFVHERAVSLTVEEMPGPPEVPSYPNPADGATLVDVGAMLRWNDSGGSPAAGEDIPINAYDRGWWLNTGSHTASNKNTFTGRGGSQLYRSFFVFNLSSAAGVPISGAKLRLEIESYYGTDPSESLTVSDVSTPIAILTASGTSVAVYDDLGSGNSYGGFTAAATDVGKILEITLSPQAVADITAAAGGLFAVGLKVDTITGSIGDEGVRLSSSSEVRVHQLVLTTGTPETYDIYFGTDNPPVTAIRSGLSGTSCEPVPHPMANETTYYWQVIAANAAGQTPGPVWSFTTIGLPGEADVTDSIPPADDMDMPFGDIIVSATRTEHITIANTDASHELVVTDISIGGGGIDDFEDGDMKEYVVMGGSHAAKAAAAHDGVFGLECGGEGWAYRNDTAATVSQGDNISYWVQPRASDGRVYCGFGATNSGTYSLVAAGNSSELVLQVNQAYGFLNLGAVSHTWTSNKWYRMEIEWKVGGDIVGRLYDSDGTTLLKSVTAHDTTYVSGGIAFRSFGAYSTYLDTVELAGSSSLPIGPVSMVSSGVDGSSDVYGISSQESSGAISGWDAENNAPIGPGAGVVTSAGRDDGSSTVAGSQYVPTASVGGFRLEGLPSLPAVIPPMGSITVDVVFEPTVAKQYTGDVKIQTNDTDEQEVTVHLSGSGIPDYLEVAPSEQQTISGHPGGPFVPSKLAYTLQNTHLTEPMNWTATKTADWLSVTPQSGTVMPGASVVVSVKWTAAARSLPQGDHLGTVTIANATTGVRHDLEVLLHVFTSPKMWVAPVEGFDVTVEQTVMLGETLTIGNSGDAALSFEIVAREDPLLLGAACSPVEAISDDSDTIVLEYSFGPPNAQEVDGYDLLVMEGLASYEKVGSPIVPVRHVEILVPRGKQVVDCQVTAEGVQELPGSFSLMPAQQPYRLSHTGPVPMTQADASVYGSDSPWPGTYLERMGMQSRRGYRVFVASLLPLQYVPSTGAVSWASRLVLTVSLEDAVDKDVLRPSKAAKSRVAASVDNPAALGTYSQNADEVASENGDASLALPPGGPYQYVIITSAALQSAPGPFNFQALCDARTADGLSATIVTTEWIYANYDGTRPGGGSDNQTRIRNFLIDAYQGWGTQYVLLGGTNALVPARLFYVSSLVGDVTNMPVDMYYGCVEPATCTFDYDADGLYGEPTDGVGGGEVDLFAEIYVGRAAVDSPVELANFVRKTLAYDASQGDYLPRIAMVGEYLGFGGVSDYATASMEQIRTGGLFDGYYTSGFEEHAQRDFIDFVTIGCMDEDPSCCWPLYDAPGNNWPVAKLTCLMNNGIHTFNHLGHANYTYCMKLYTTDLGVLSNDDYFFIYSQGCMPGGFDTANCFAETITSMEHGAFAVVMNARYGYGMSNSTAGPSQYYDREFWDAVLGEGVLELGRANQDSKEDNIARISGACMRWIYYELNLFGDPAQGLRLVEDACDWLQIEPQGGTVEAGAAAAGVNVIFAPGLREPGTYSATIIIRSNDGYDAQYVELPVTMTVVPAPFAVIPEDGLTSTAVMGGPFKPCSGTYTLDNSGTASCQWQAVADVPWLSVTPAAGTMGAAESAQVEVLFNTAAMTLEPGRYDATVTFTDVTRGVDYQRTVALEVTAPDFFTELFDEADNDTDNLTLTFAPHDSGHFYIPCLEPAYGFPVDPSGGDVLPLMDDDFWEVVVDAGRLIPFYGELFDAFYVGSNGYITFETGDIMTAESLEWHFEYLRISALFDDLNPAAGGTVSWKQTGDAVVVTYQDVPEYNSSSLNSFQVEMFFDGTIRITWLDISASDGLAGLSAGYGLAEYFVENDLSGYGSCLVGDFDRDEDVDWTDMTFLAGYWLAEGCNPGDSYCSACDRTRDGRVNFEDFCSFSENWSLEP